MSKKFSHIALAVFAAFFLWISPGVNVFHFCCSTCAEYGGDVFLLTSCEEIHASHDCADSGGRCCARTSVAQGCSYPGAEQLAAVPEGCGVEIYTVDTHNLVNIHYYFYAPVCTVPDALPFKAVCMTESGVATQYDLGIQPYDSSGRELLSLVSTLLI